MKKYIVSYLTFDANGMVVVNTVKTASEEEAHALAVAHQTKGGFLGKIYER